VLKAPEMGSLTIQAVLPGIWTCMTSHFTIHGKNWANFTRGLTGALYNKYFLPPLAMYSLICPHTAFVFLWGHIALETHTRVTG